MSSFKSPCKVEDQNLQCNHALFYPSRRIYQSCLPLSLHEFNEKLFCSSFETGFTPFVTSFCTGFTPLVDYQICLFYGCWLWGLEEARYCLWFLNVFFAFHVTCHSSTAHIWQIKLNLAFFALGRLYIRAFYQPFLKQWITQPFFFEISCHFKGTNSKKDRMDIQ